MAMGTLTRFDPFEDALPGLFKNFPRMALPQMWRENELDIRLDVTESDKEYKVKAEIPGVKKEDINVQVDGNTVTISAEIKKEKEDKNERTVRQERYFGSVSRSFTLASAVDEREASAKYENGVLELRLPKKEGGSAKRLAIS
jgi:HSP20 family protein